MAALACLVVAGCLTAYTTSQYSHPDGLITPLEKLTPAIQAFVRYPDPKHPLLDDQVVTEVYKQNPDLARAFQHVHVLIHHDATNVVVLICATNQNIALLEDASWTAGIDKLHFKSNPPSPAVFTISLPGTPP